MKRQHNIIRWCKWSCCSWVLFASLVCAQSMVNLYQAQAPVANRSSAARQVAIRQALVAVLVKVSGNADIASVPQVNTRLKQLDKLVQQYSYVSTDSNALQLQVQFDSTAVNTLLSDAGQALWPNQRPHIAVWLAIVSDNQRVILVSDDTMTNHAIDAINQVFNASATRRGIPIVWPSLALLAQQTVSFATVYSLSEQDLLPSLPALRADALLIGRVVQQPTHTWQANWSFSINDEHMQWQTQGGDLATVFDGVMTDIADSLSQRFAILPNQEQQQSVILTIDAVHDANTYARIMRYLAQLPLVTQVDVIDVNSEQIVVALRATGGSQALQQAVNFGHVLEPTLQQSMRYRVKS